MLQFYSFEFFESLVVPKMELPKPFFSIWKHESEGVHFDQTKNFPKLHSAENIVGFSNFIEKIFISSTNNHPQGSEKGFILKTPPKNWKNEKFSLGLIVPEKPQVALYARSELKIQRGNFG